MPTSLKRWMELDCKDFEIIQLDECSSCPDGWIPHVDRSDCYRDTSAEQALQVSESSNSIALIVGISGGVIAVLGIVVTVVLHFYRKAKE